MHIAEGPLTLPSPLPTIPSRRATGASALGYLYILSDDPLPSTTGVFLDRSRDPMEAYRRCELAVRQLLERHVENPDLLDATMNRLMAHVQQYAIALARFRR